MAKGRVVGIVGSEGAKFTALGERHARNYIRSLLARPDVVAVSSGHCHLGGIDIWAEEVADELELEKLIFPPKFRGWEAYKKRNLQIARASTEVHCITIATYPPHYDGMRFDFCYHCGTDEHVKSGGCWTVKQARRMGKSGFVHVIRDQ
jgi:hypothetical protein